MKTAQTCSWRTCPLSIAEIFSTRAKAGRGGSQPIPGPLALRLHFRDHGTLPLPLSAPVPGGPGPGMPPFQLLVLYLIVLSNFICALFFFNDPHIFLLYSMYFFKFYLFIFGCVVSLLLCAGFLQSRWGGLLFVVAHGLLIVVASLVAEPRF